MRLGVGSLEVGLASWFFWGRLVRFGLWVAGLCFLGWLARFTCLGGGRVASASFGAAELALVWFLPSLVSGCLPFLGTGLSVGLRDRDCMSWLFLLLGLPLACSCIWWLACCADPRLVSKSACEEGSVCVPHSFLFQLSWKAGCLALALLLSPFRLTGSQGLQRWAGVFPLHMRCQHKLSFSISGFPPIPGCTKVEGSNPSLGAVWLSSWWAGLLLAGWACFHHTWFHLPWAGPLGPLAWAWEKVG
ncbi:hypothetical protein OIU84_025712 [Salix udensis]|uniref:Uncharacterized protein n=1 Tax=Salix udensis TaxID=889485 RepID=A0AAD6KK86_9ROSI|nr:hypothetical protein OIU84_025712 [Salix udensis]